MKRTGTVTSRDIPQDGNKLAEGARAYEEMKSREFAQLGEKAKGRKRDALLADREAAALAEFAEALQRDPAFKAWIEVQAIRRLRNMVAPEGVTPGPGASLLDAINSAVNVRAQQLAEERHKEVTDD